MRWLLLLLALTAQAEEYSGYTGYWMEVCATAYSPHDPIDGKYRAKKGKWLHKTADGVTDVRTTPYGVAVPLKPSTTVPWLPFGTRLIIPTGYGYLDNSRSNRVFKVDDVGNGKEYFKRDAKNRLHLDFRFRSYASAIEWAGPEGKRIVRVFVITGLAENKPETFPDLFQPIP